MAKVFLTRSKPKSKKTYFSPNPGSHVVIVIRPQPHGKQLVVAAVRPQSQASRPMTTLDIRALQNLTATTACSCWNRTNAPGYQKLSHIFTLQRAIISQQPTKLKLLHNLQAPSFGMQVTDSRRLIPKARPPWHRAQTKSVCFGSNRI